MEKVLNYSQFNFQELCLQVANIPYGRNYNPANLNSVIIENKGTCSSKHRYLSSVSKKYGVQAHLYMGLFLMDSQNTPKIKTILKKYNLSEIPEVHCYLEINNQKFDYTFPRAYKNYFLNIPIIIEQQVDPVKLYDEKIPFHQELILDWIQTTHLSLSLDDIWKIREECIRNLSA